VVFALVSAAVLGVALAVTLLRPLLGLGEQALVAITAAAAALVLACQLGALVWLGGRLVRRFDVARDR
jgi:hypothetical protein